MSKQPPADWRPPWRTTATAAIAALTIGVMGWIVRNDSVVVRFLTSAEMRSNLLTGTAKPAEWSEAWASGRSAAAINLTTLGCLGTLTVTGIYATRRWWMYGSVEWRSANGRCVVCAYDLCFEGETCPECGSPYALRQTREYDPCSWTELAQKVSALDSAIAERMTGERYCETVG